MNPIDDLRDAVPWVPNAHDIRVEVHKGRGNGNDPIVHDRAKVVEGTDEDPEKLKLKKTEGEIVHVRNSDIHRQKYWSWEFFKWKWQDYMEVYQASNGKYLPLRFADADELLKGDLEELSEELADLKEKGVLEEQDIDVSHAEKLIEDFGSRKTLMADADYRKRWEDATESQVENTMNAWNKKKSWEKYVAPAVIVIAVLGQIIMIKQFGQAMESRNEAFLEAVEQVNYIPVLAFGHPTISQMVRQKVGNLKERIF